MIRSATACCSSANGWKASARIRSVFTPLTHACGPAQMSWPLLALTMSMKSAFAFLAAVRSASLSFTTRPRT